jgi:MtrB/PioB family decaheme-associated outer membrane protein
MQTKDGLRKRSAVVVAGLAMSLLFGTPLAAAENENDPPSALAESLRLLWSPLKQAVAQEKAKAAAAPAPAPAAQTWHIFTQLGVSGYDFANGQNLAGRFQNFRDIPRGFNLGALDLRYLNKDSAWLLSLDATEIRERDQRIVADAWRVGKFRTQIYWDEIPQFFSNSPTLYQQTADGVLQVSPAIRAALEAALGGPGASPQPRPNGLPPAFFAAVRRELAVAPVVEIGTRRETGLFSQSWTPNDTVEVHFQAGQIRKRGRVPFGTGTFARQNLFPVPPLNTPCPGRPTTISPCDGYWEALGAELPAPIDWRTGKVAGGVRLSGKIWLVGLDYDYERFHDSVNGLTYDNWFRVTDAAGAPAGSAVGRERFARSQVAYPPSSDFHHVLLRAGFDLPHDSQLRGAFSWSEVSQNDAFLPYSLNTALSATGPGLAGFDLTNTANLPRQSLDGKIRTINQDYAFVTRFVKPVTFRLQYRSEDLDNNSPHLVFPGFSRFGESHWVTSLDYYGVPAHNRPESYDKHDVKASARFDIAKALSATLEYQFERWNRTFRNVPRSDEHTGRVHLDYTPAPAFALRADYRYSDRRPDTYLVQPLVFNSDLSVPEPGGPGWEILRGVNGAPLHPLNPELSLEFNQLRKFDIGPRKRHEGVGTADVRLGTAASVSGSFRYVRDDYNEIPATPAPDYSNLFYGLLYDETWNGSVELSVTPGEGTVLFVDYTRQQDRYGYLSMGNLITNSVVNKDPCCAQYPIRNSWERNNRTHLDSLHIGANYATPGDGWVFDASYTLSLTKEITRTSNPFPPILANSARTATVYPYPDVIDRFQELLFSVTRKFSKALDVGFQYRYEPYRIDDFYLNDLAAYAYPQLTVGGETTNVQRYLFLNSRYGDYTAHQVAAFLKYRY